MDNKNLRNLFQSYISLLELHQKNSFKIRSYQNFLFSLDKIESVLCELPHEDRIKIDGVNDSISKKIEEINTTGSFSDYNDLLTLTPKGILEILKIKGLGVKKVLALWQEHNITTVNELKKACKDNVVANLKGFGKKTQQNILDNLAFVEQQIGKYLLVEIEDFANHLNDLLINWLDHSNIALVGQFARKLPVIDKLEYTISGYSSSELIGVLEKELTFKYLKDISQPKTVKIQLQDPFVKVYFHLSSPEEFLQQKIINSSGPGHLQYLIDNKSVKSKVLKSTASSDVDVYNDMNVAYTPPETREGYVEFTEGFDEQKLISDYHLRGILHNHSTYSDGKNTLKEMALYCQELGYEYLGISDHSVSAFYANGLDAERVKQQQKEIEELNKELAPFKIFKGIESDILNDGSLDYPDEILQSFDFIVASVHSNLRMDKKKATERLIKAIENPYTTILGHMTGRLLLRREGYPIDHEKVIDACAEHNVVIEINSNPWRIDIDWTWINYALEKGVKLSINPDAHETQGYHCMKYGVYAGRKGGLKPDQCLNTMSKNEIENYFSSSKK